MSRRIDLDSVLTFGKYRSRSVEDVLTGCDGGEPDPRYLLWALENDVIEVDAALQDQIERTARGGR